jgi:hypothetical protein
MEIVKNLWRIAGLVYLFGAALILYVSMKCFENELYFGAFYCVLLMFAILELFKFAKDEVKDGKRD